MKTKCIHCGVVVLLLAALFLPASAMAAVSSVTGVIGGLSPATRTVTIQKSDGSQVLLRTTEHSRLTRNGKAAQFASLALRDQVTAQFQGSAIGRLDAQGPALDSSRGVFTAFDAAANKLTMATTHGSRSFLISSTTLVVRNGAPASAQGLAKGDALLVHSVPLAAGSPSGTLATAADIAADGPEEEDVEGTISAISGQDVTVTPQHGSAVTVHVGTSTVIKIADASGVHTATLADLATGMKAAADYDPVSLVADHILARAAAQHQAEVEGTVSAVDASAGTISITPEHGGTDVVLKTGSSTRISRNGGAATLADIKVGDRAEARYDATSKLASRIEAHSPPPPRPSFVEGSVTAVSATSITIAPHHGNPVTLTIDSTTHISRNGHSAAAADIKTGDRAAALYVTATLLAQRIDAVGDHGGGHH